MSVHCRAMPQSAPCCIICCVYYLMPVPILTLYLDSILTAYLDFPAPIYRAGKHPPRSVRANRKIVGRRWVNMNGRASKNKGSEFERELVNQAKERGLDAERAYASNGRALGEVEAVDLMVNGCRIQAKRRKALASFLQIPEGADAVVFRQDRGPTLALIPWSTLLELIWEGF